MNNSIHRYIFPIFWVISFVLLIAKEASGQSLTIGGGNQTLTITTGIPGGQLVDVVNATCTLTYVIPLLPLRNWKITVNSSCPGQNFDLSVVATNVTRGTAAPEVALLSGNPAIDFITGIGPSFWQSYSCRLNYTASATFAQGNSTEVGNDVHTVTYTLLQP
jgi:hypothetical protein